MGIRSLLSGAAQSRPAATVTAEVPPSAAALQDAILEHRCTVALGLALAEALEREGRPADALDALVAANRQLRDGQVERRIVRLRRAAAGRVDHALAPAAWPHFALPDEPAPPPGPLETTPEGLTPSTLARGVLRHGHLLVRGLVPAPRVARLRDVVERAFAAQWATYVNGPSEEEASWCDPLAGIPDGDHHRLMVRASQGVLAADAPRALWEWLETVHDLGLDRLIAAYLGERPALSAKKCTLRRVDPSEWRVRHSNWHQDGSFLGEGVRSLNVWVSLSRCGRDAPGMELIPIRLTRLLSRGEEGTQFDWTVAPETIAHELPQVPIWRPELEAGDALFFDHWSLHRTAAYEGMTNLRYAIESWFFAPSAYGEHPSTALLV
jgi:hypothetical protein